MFEPCNLVAFWAIVRGSYSIDEVNVIRSWSDLMASEWGVK